MPKTFDGIITYEILPDGCLNGVYSNDHPDTGNRLYNEIARKVTDDSADQAPLAGRYVCAYTNPGNTISQCTLVIHSRPTRRRNGQYHFEWRDADDLKIFEGTGWQVRDNQVVVSYRDVVPAER